jgi:hypothetical protein
MDKTPTTPPAVAIDYENLDVAELNEKIQAAAASMVPAPAAQTPEPAPAAAPPVVPPAASGPPPPGLKTKLKGKVNRLLKPFFPLMRAMALPLHEDVAAVVRSLDASNRRVDEYILTLNRSQEYIKLLHLLNHNLVVEVTKLRLEHEALRSRVKLLEKDLDFLVKRERAVEERVFPE